MKRLINMSGPLVALLLAGGAALGSCWVSNGTSNLCCAPNAFICGVDPDQWSCTQTTNAGPFSVRIVRMAGSGENGLTGLVNSAVGSCTRTLYTCGQEPGECTPAGTAPITCNNTDPTGDICTGGGGQ
jgi:hypothetical protein